VLPPDIIVPCGTSVLPLFDTRIAAAAVEIGIRAHLAASLGPLVPAYVNNSKNSIASLSDCTGLKACQSTLSVVARAAAAAAVAFGTLSRATL
jgi:hypothetical protein